MTSPNDGFEAFHARSGVPTLGYIAASRPVVAKTHDGIVHATPEDAFRAIDALDPALRPHLNVYEVLTYVSPDPVPPSMTIGS